MVSQLGSDEAIHVLRIGEMEQWHISALSQRRVPNVVVKFRIASVLSYASKCWTVCYPEACGDDAT